MDVCLQVPTGSRESAAQLIMGPIACAGTRAVTVQLPRCFSMWVDMNRRHHGPGVGMLLCKWASSSAV